MRIQAGSSHFQIAREIAVRVEQADFRYISGRHVFLPPRLAKKALDSKDRRAGIVFVSSQLPSLDILKVLNPCHNHTSVVTLNFRMGEMPQQLRTRNSELSNVGAEFHFGVR